MSRVLLPFPAQQAMAASLAEALGARVGRLDWRRFPDGESLVAIEDDLSGSDIAVVASLDRPDDKALALRFAAMTAREFGARSVGLVAPYLAYMRQDARFHRGEAVSAPLFARFIGEAFDWLVTVDPHLHRYDRLDAVYPVPAHRVPSAALVGAWIGREIPDAVLLGPDEESAQWVDAMARHAGRPFQVLRKVRRGDRDVSVSAPDMAAIAGGTAVVVDDIVSSGRTMIETVRQLREAGIARIACVVIHAVFADDAEARLREAGAGRIVSTDAIPHPTNAIALAPLLAPACAPFFREAQA